MNEPTDKNPQIPSDQGSHETAALYVPANRLAKVDAIDVFTPVANRVMGRDQAMAPTTLHEREGTVVMPPLSGSSRSATSSSGTIATSVLKRLHGSDSDELFGAALRSKQDSLISGNTPRFNVIGRLGEGSQGIVYRVNDRDCHREVACKVLSYATSDPEEISRFIHEAQVTAQLEHPGVVPIHDLGELRDGTVYYTMKRVDGASLQDLLTDKGGKLEHRYALLETFLRVCETMAFAHSRGVIHRDLKPRNIMVGPFGEVLVLDWGLAKVVNCIDVARPMGTMRSFPEADPYRTLNGTAVGTPAYMSPEQAMGEVDTLDRRCDVYSLGVILYEILAGASPYVRGEARKVMHQVSHGMWTRLDARRDCPPLPRALVAIVHRAMAFERSDRYATVEQLSDDLRAFIAGGSVSVYQETAVERLARLLTHHKRQVRTGLAVAGLAAGIGALIWAHLWYDNERTIAEHQQKLDERLAQRDYVEARARAERILTLRPGDSRIMLQVLPRIDEGMRSQEAARHLAEKRDKANELITEARAVAATDDEASQSRAGELYMQALGLVGDDPAITSAYQDVSRRLAALEQQRRAAKDQERKELAAQLQIESAKRDLHWVGRLRVDLAKEDRQRRALEAANRTSEDPTLRARLHRMEERIEDLRKQLAAHEGRAAIAYDQAIAFAPSNEKVRAQVADYYAELMLDYEARGETAGALMAESRCRMFDNGRHTEVLSGQGWVRAAKGQTPLTIQVLSESADRTLDPQETTRPVPEDAEQGLLHGRYLVRNTFGVVQAIQLKRGAHLELVLPTPPARLPDTVAFIPAGSVRDSDGSLLEEVPSFALARLEVTCGEWLAFLNDPATREAIDEAERTGNRILVPRLDGKPLWPRADGMVRLPDASDPNACEATWPISHISGADALAYVKWLAKRDQLPWRLPTHGEWQLAAQGGDGRPYPWGLRAELGFSASAIGSPQGHWCTSPVGSHPRDRSVQGVMDLAGSVAELVLVDGAVRLAAGGSYRDRQPEAFGVFSYRDAASGRPEPGIGLRLALTIPEQR